MASYTNGAHTIRVNFSVDGQLRSTDAVSPFRFDWDTTVQRDGSHSLEAEAIAANGRVARLRIHVNVANRRREKLIIRHFAGITADCSTCAVSLVNNGVTASLRDFSMGDAAAYGLRDFGGPDGWSGRIWSRDLIRLRKNQIEQGSLSLLQVRDVENELVYEVLARPDGTIVLRSPAGGLSASVN